MTENHIETGGCLCGKIKYEFNRKDVISAGHCHCKDCQKITGSGKATIVFTSQSSMNCVTSFSPSGRLDAVR